MPEGHTIHRLARNHNRWFAGRVVTVSSPQGRFEDASTLTGATFISAEAWGKHLFHHWDDGSVVHVHLGLFGRFRSYRTSPPAPRPTVRMRMISEDRTVDLIGPTACERVSPGRFASILARLGPDPLRNDSDPDEVWQRLQRRRVGIGQALMDQSVLAGVGNVYRADLLFAHGIHPERPAKSIDADTWQAMWWTLKRWMPLGVETGRIITTDPACSPSRLRARDRLLVYKKTRCVRCEGAVSSWDIAGRRVYACERCQPRCV